MSSSARVPEDLESVSSGSEATADILDLKDDEGWEDVEPEEQNEQIVSLFDDAKFPDVPSMLSYCKEKYQFDLLAIRSKLSLDFYGTIKLVNFIRSMVQKGETVSPGIAAQDFSDDAYLRPVLEDDALLFNIDELPDSVVSSSNVQPDAEASSKVVARVAELEEELKRMQLQFSEYRSAVEQTLDRRWNENPETTSTRNLEQEHDKSYFHSYSYNDIHETMLKDAVRTDGYRDFIYNNKSLFANKVVLDVGCGTGILSLFCAKAGAAKVIAVDNSAIIEKARENIYNNGMADKITCLRGRIEDVKLPVDKVDIIVSEWMGYCLLFEAMFDSVIWARDKYLKPDGLLVPSHMNLWIAPIEDPDYTADHVTFWRDVYGFDMKPMQAGIYEDSQVLHMPTKTLCAEPASFLQLDLHTATVKDLSFKKSWEATLNRDISQLDGFAVWFDTFFMRSRDRKVPTNAKAEEWSKDERDGNAFTTGPFGKETHWRQGVFFIDNLGGANPHKAGSKISGEIEYAVPEEFLRGLNVTVSWSINEDKGSQMWKMT